MKIIQLIYSLSSGGAEHFVVDLSNELANHGHDVHIVVFRSNAKSKKNTEFYNLLISNNVTYHNLSIKEGFRLSAFIKVKNIIKQIRPDIVHGHLNVIPYLFPIALFTKEIKYIHTLHNLAEHTVGTGIQKKLNKYFYKTGKIKVVTISKICEKSYENFYNLHNAQTIENGRLPVKPRLLYDNVVHEIKQYKNGVDTFVFLHVAHFSKQKNQTLLIDAFNNLHKRKIPFLLLIIGRNYDTGEGKLLQKKSCQAIKFLGEKSNVDDYLLNADAFCLSSQWEGHPISLLEALSAGCTPICTPAGGIPDIITDGVNGYLSKSFSTEDYVDNLLKFINNTNKIKKEQLINYFQNNYSIKVCAKNYLNFYEQINQ